MNLPSPEVITAYVALAQQLEGMALALWAKLRPAGLTEEEWAAKKAEILADYDARIARAEAEAGPIAQGDV
jgi:hypothetical protein